MKDHEKNFGMYYRVVLPYPLDFESRYMAEDLDWDWSSSEHLFDGCLTESLKIDKGYIRSA